MKKLIQVLGLVASISMVGVTPSFATSICLPLLGCIDLGGGGGGGGGGAPAPEIGASVLGMLMASGVALYIYRRRRG